MSDLLHWDFEGHTIEAMPFGDDKGEPLFDAILIAKALGYKKPHDAIARHVDQDDSVKRGVIDALGRKQTKIFVREAGLWALVLRADTPPAKRLQRFVSATVLPAIRKYGVFIPELEVKIAAFIGKELAAWAMLFPPQFWAGLDRLYGVKRADPNRRPMFYAQAVALVYECLDPDIHAAMRLRVPEPRKSGTKQHQALSDFGRSQMMPHVMRCIGMMDLCTSAPEWFRSMRSVFGRQQSLPLKGVQRLPAKSSAA